jgi:hypothetical protein
MRNSEWFHMVNQGHRMAAGVREEILRVFEAQRLQPIRIKQLLNRMPHRGIVIENALDLGCWGIGSAPDTNQVLVLTYDT